MTSKKKQYVRDDVQGFANRVSELAIEVDRLHTSPTRQF
jgi:hypothetical protein